MKFKIDKKGWHSIPGSLIHSHIRHVSAGKFGKAGGLYAKDLKTNPKINFTSKELQNIPKEKLVKEIIYQYGFTSKDKRDDIFEGLDDYYNQDYILDTAQELREKEKITDEEWEGSQSLQDRIYEQANHMTIEEQSKMADLIFKILNNKINLTGKSISDFIDEKIQDNKAEMNRLQREIEDLEDQKSETRKKKGISKWVGYDFESSSSLTPEFAQFYKDFKKHIKSVLPKDSELVEFYRGHFEFSGFIKRGNKYVYFSTSDVRYFKDEWYNNILIRTAKDKLDYTGGSNHFTSLENFTESVNRLLGGMK